MGFCFVCAGIESRVSHTVGMPPLSHARHATPEPHPQPSQSVLIEFHYSIIDTDLKVLSLVGA